jgi:site-specific recombinase XerD
VRELETTLQQFGEFLLRGRLVRERAAPYCVGWVRRFLTRPASNEAMADQVRRFCEELGRANCQDWQVRQAEEALRIYFVNFLKRADWVRRFLGYLAERQRSPEPRVDSGAFRDYLTHLAVRQRVSASTQNQALCAILFLYREVLGHDADSVSNVPRAKRGAHLPVVLSVPETAALLGAMAGTTWLMAALIYGGGLRVSECCELRIKDLDFDQGLVVVRSGKGGKDRTTLLAETGRDELRTHLRKVDAVYDCRPPRRTRRRLASRLLLNGVDIRQIQEYLGHANVETTMVYTHVVKDLRNPPRSPLDALGERTLTTHDSRLKTARV